MRCSGSLHKDKVTKAEIGGKVKSRIGADHVLDGQANPCDSSNRLQAGHLLLSLSNESFQIGTLLKIQLLWPLKVSMSHHTSVQSTKPITLMYNTVVPLSCSYNALQYIL